MYDVCIYPTEFKDLRTGEVSVGVLVSDDYVSMYIRNEILETIPDDNMELLEKIIEYMTTYTHCDINHLWNMFNGLKEHGKLEISGKTYYWKDIEHLFVHLPEKKPVYGWL